MNLYFDDGLDNTEGKDKCFTGTYCKRLIGI